MVVDIRVHASFVTYEIEIFKFISILVWLFLSDDVVLLWGDKKNNTVNFTSGKEKRDIFKIILKRYRKFHAKIYCWPFNFEFLFDFVKMVINLELSLLGE